jgi:hypothetical protein
MGKAGRDNGKTWIPKRAWPKIDQARHTSGAEFSSLHFKTGV